jgi:DNA-directed RNA polymerase subunit RPC12/RpoP
LEAEEAEGAIWEGEMIWRCGKCGNSGFVLKNIRGDEIVYKCLKCGLERVIKTDKADRDK